LLFYRIAQEVFFVSFFSLFGPFLLHGFSQNPG
jgi:hypothetical protein